MKPVLCGDKPTHEYFHKAGEDVYEVGYWKTWDDWVVVATYQREAYAKARVESENTGVKFGRAMSKWRRRTNGSTI